MLLSSVSVDRVDQGAVSDSAFTLVKVKAGTAANPAESSGKAAMSGCSGLVRAVLEKLSLLAPTGRVSLLSRPVLLAEPAGAAWGLVTGRLSAYKCVMSALL